MPESVVTQYSDFFNNDGGFEKVKKDFNKLSEDLIAKAKEVREKTKIIDISNTAAVSKLTAETQKLIEAKKKQAATLKNLEGLEKKDQAQRRKTAKAITAQTEALKKQNVEARLIGQIQNTVSGSIENLRARLKLTTLAWSKLTEAEIKNGGRAKRVADSVANLNAKLKQLERSVGNNTRDVGNYNKALTGLRAGFIRVSQAAGVTLGLFGAFRVIRGAINIIRDFEKQTATLAGVLDKTKAEISSLVVESRRLGEETVKTATEVAQLQTAYARLGFTIPEILELTASTVNGSIALNARLEDTALLVGAVVNSFSDLEAADAPDIIDKLSKSTTISALNFEKLALALPKVLGAANVLKIPLTEVLAVLGKLSDAGLEASIAGTSFRNVLIRSNKVGLNYREALEEIRKSTDKTATSTRLFGVRAAISGLILAENTEGLEELKKEIDDFGGAAERLAKKQLDTLDGAILRVTSAWESLILTNNELTGAGNALKDTFVFLADNLKTIAKLVAIATTTYITHNIVTRISNRLTKTKALLTGQAAVAHGVEAGAIRGATIAQRAYNLVLKSNPLGILITLLAAAATAYFLFRDSVGAAARAQEKFNEQRPEFTAEILENIKKENELVAEKIDVLQNEIDLRKAKGESDKKLDEEFLKRQTEILLAEKESEFNKVEASKKIVAGIKEEIEAEKEIIKELSQPGRFRGDFERLGIENADTRIEELTFLNLQEGTLLSLREKRHEDLVKTLLALEGDLIVQTAKNTTALTNEQKKRIKELEILQRRVEDLRDSRIGDDELKELAIVTRSFQRQIDAIKGNSEVERTLRKELEEQLRIEVQEITDKFSEIKQKKLKEAQDQETRLIQDDVEREIAQLRINTAKLIKEIEDNEFLKQNAKARITEKINKDSAKKEQDIRLKEQLKQIDNERRIQEAILIQTLALKRESFKSEEQFELFKQRELLRIQKNALESQLTALEAIAGDEFEVQIEEILASISDINLEINAIGKELDIDPWKEFIEELKNAFTEAAKVISSKLLSAVQESQRALNEQDKAVDSQRKRAENGLENTLAFEQKEQAKREKELIDRQKRLDQINRLSAYWNTYNANIASLKSTEDSGDAIRKTLTSIAIVEGLTASLTRFSEGGVVEDKLPADGIFRGPSDKNGGRGIPILVGGKEGIFSANEMGNLGKDNFYKLKHAASMGPVDGNFFAGQRKVFMREVATTNNNDLRVVSELQAVKRAIESKPSQQLNVPELVGGILQFTETISTMNMTKRNHYKINKPRL